MPCNRERIRVELDPPRSSSGMKKTKRSSKYEGLYHFLAEASGDAIHLSFAEVERIIQGQLPPSARRDQAFWSNRKRGAVQASAWISAGFRVASVDLELKTVAFERVRSRYSVRREGNSYRWGSESVKALREHLGASQADLAKLLGVRQQTVSEWETGLYVPTRARSNHLTLVAERAKFPFKSNDDD
jgi:DNA-binding transcriptional regulator YiaG